MLSFYAIGVFAAGIMSTFFGLLVYFNNRKALPNILYGFMSLSFAVWCFSWVAMILLGNQNVNQAYFFARLLNFGAIFIPIFYFHWILLFLGIAKEHGKIIMLAYVLAFIFAIFCWNPLYIKGVHSILFFPFWPTAGPLYKWYLIFVYFTFAPYAFYFLVKYFSKTTGYRKNQIKYIMFGSLLGFGAGAVNFPLMYGINPFGPFATFGIYISLAIFITFPIPLSYAALKYRLMDIKVILTEFLVGIIALILIIQAFAAETSLLKIFGIFILGLFGVTGYFLIRSVMREIELRGALELAYQELKKLDDAKSEFISIASHQLRTPLTAVKGYVSMILEKSYGKVPDKMNQPLENVYASNERLIKLVNDILNISKIEAGKMEMELEKASLEEMILDIINELKVKADAKNLYLKYEKPETPVPVITIDKTKIRQVILNIIDNSIKYTLKGGTTVELGRMNSEVRIKVSDTGVGLEKSDIPRLFESFSRGRNGSIARAEGTGLGLYIARRFIEMHQGKIWAESPGKGKGSTFFIELPIK